jgi:endonuclease YncB( thermonuclease family)
MLMGVENDRYVGNRRAAGRTWRVTALLCGAALLGAACGPLVPPGQPRTPAPWPTVPQPRRTPLPLAEATAAPAMPEPTATRGAEAFINHQKTRVLRVWDGQSVLVENGVTVRYLGVQAPSAGAFGRPSAPGGATAAQRNADLVEGKEIVLEQDVTDVDENGHLPRYVYVDGEMVNRLLLQEGLIQTVIQPPDTRYEQDLLAAEQDAWAAKRGVWVSAATMTRTPVVRPRATLRPAAPAVVNTPVPAATATVGAPRFGADAPEPTQPTGSAATAVPQAPAPTQPAAPVATQPVPAATQPAAPVSTQPPPAAPTTGAIPRFGQ